MSLSNPSSLIFAANHKAGEASKIVPESPCKVSE